MDSKINLAVFASTRGTDLQAIIDAIKKGELENVSEKTAKLDLQGPLSKEVIKDVLGFNTDLPFFGLTQFDISGKSSIISRTGYTGEFGYEIFIFNINL